MLRRIEKTITGQQTVDGAGVRLVRVLGRETAEAFDPFLMLDSFDSRNPQDYIKGFPMHPHRGIETITYLIAGEMDHEDSLGNTGTIHAGESQWMTAGRGILHQEMPRTSEHMLGVQLWLNLPAHNKMTPPAYNGITAGDIPIISVPDGTVRLIAGAYGNCAGVTPKYIQAGILDVALEPGGDITLPTRMEDTAFLFTITGSAIMGGGELVAKKTAVLFGPGDKVQVAAPKDNMCRFIFCTGQPLHEPIAWGGPIVMNSPEELRQAFAALGNGTFIQAEKA